MLVGAELRPEQFRTLPRSWDNQTAQRVDQTLCDPPNRRTSFVKGSSPNRQADPRLNHIRQFRLGRRSLETELQKQGSDCSKFWHGAAPLADIGQLNDLTGGPPYSLPSASDVRFTPKSGHDQRGGDIRFVPKADQVHCSKRRTRVSYSITSLALDRKSGEIASPRARAVRRLTTKSTFEDALMGRSPGFSPRKIRST